MNDIDSNYLSRIEIPDDSKFASTASRIVGLYQPEIEDRRPETLKAKADQLLALLGTDIRKKVQLELDSRERRLWTNLPARPDAGGIRLGVLNKAQIESTLDLLAHLLSPQGYEKMRLIMLADDQLLRGGRSRPGFGTEYFSIVLFGEPSTSKPW
ncbi:MAG: DUF3500 domain-containing protein, partial [Planctomycetota bacterium]